MLLRVAPSVARSFEAGPQCLDVDLHRRPQARRNDNERVDDFWPCDGLRSTARDARHRRASGAAGTPVACRLPDGDQRLGSPSGRSCPMDGRRSAPRRLRVPAPMPSGAPGSGPPCRGAHTSRPPRRRRTHVDVPALRAVRRPRVVPNGCTSVRVRGPALLRDRRHRPPLEDDELEQEAATGVASYLRVKPDADRSRSATCTTRRCCSGAAPRPKRSTS
jgi:hypothetical protein